MPLKKEYKILQKRAERLEKLEKKKGYNCSRAGYELNKYWKSDAGLFLAQECKYGKTSKMIKGIAKLLKQDNKKTTKKAVKKTTKKVTKKTTKKSTKRKK